MTSRLLFLLIFAVFGHPLAHAADDIVVPAVLVPLSYQERLVACSVYFGAKARESAQHNSDVEIRRVHALRELRYEAEVLVAQNEVMPTIRSRVATAVGNGVVGEPTEEAVAKYCRYAAMSATRHLSKEGHAQIQKQAEYDYRGIRCAAIQPTRDFDAVLQCIATLK